MKISSLCLKSSIIYIDLQRGFVRTPRTPSPTRLIRGHQNKRSALRLCQPKFEKKFVHFSNILIGSVTRVAGKFITWTSFTSSLKLQLCTYQCKSCGGECGQGVGIWCLRLSPCRVFDRAKGPRGRDIWLWPTEAWYQFRSGCQVRLSRLSESHAVGERCEVFICFNRHNPIL